MTINVGLHLKNYKSFGPTGIRLKEIKLINVIVGRNNIGKSALLHTLDYLCKDGQNLLGISKSIELTQNLDEAALRQAFRPSMNGGELGGNHWRDHGQNFLGASFTWKYGIGTSIEFVRTNAVASPLEIEYLSGIQPPEILRGLYHVKLGADRDITPESVDMEMVLSSDGIGATLIIHKYLQHVGYDRSLIQGTLLAALNQIFFPDIIFNEITTRFHSSTNQWEIFLGEAGKGIVALSASGSGIKTVLLTLLNLLIRPNFESLPIDAYIFSLEELENNLHPALQRNLFAYLHEFALSKNCHIFLTTHSNVAIDIFGSSEHSQILHILKGEDGVIGHTYTGSAVGHGVLDDLGVRASDLLQANGLIWVEGPSDRVYLKKWIELWSDNNLNEGTHYQFVYYGGSVLANIDVRLAETKEAIAAFKINRNFAFICDGDRKSASSPLKPRVAKLIGEVAGTRAMVWVTRCKEIENYIPKEVFEKVHEVAKLENIGEFEAVQDYLRANKISRALDYTNKHNKAFAYAEHMTKQNLSFRPELELQISELVKKIYSWNS
ncbi:ATP-dependent nuclease [Pseudomonas viridiflava]|uniref:ATP-dependent nuclease n=1 Tax=Pseudomonas viridiflava TaxID=33069 RepID=UPI000F068F86|nr:AAA family ATPase [Pseudomonas viridiflava]